MNENTRFWIGLVASILVPILVLGFAGASKFGQLNARLDSIEKRLDRMCDRTDKNLDLMGKRLDQMNTELGQMNQNFIEHLRNHNEKD